MIRHCIFFFLAACLAVTALAKDKALIVTGSLNHKWEETTPELERMLAEAGFDVAVVTDITQLNADTFKDLKLIVSNWNSWKRGGYDLAKEAEWTPQIRGWYEAAVREGCGHLMLHSGSSSGFEDWEAYPQISLATWQRGKTRHDKPFSFRIEKAAEHPITAGMPQGIMSHPKEELWENAGITAKNTETIINGIDKKGEPHPSVIVGNYGKGRCVAVLLGHSTASFDDTFKAVFLRSAQWAANGTPTFPYSPTPQSAAPAVE